jgi:acyloxyacyl hydrolase
VFNCDLKALRGTSWRGKDCNDFNAKIHPGAKPTGSDELEDSNCNGIFVNKFF